ncbi:ADP-ribosylation factor 1 [Botrytis cinerea]
MEKNGTFADFDQQVIYEDSLDRAGDENTRNFVVEFGKLEARIAFDLNANQVKRLLDEPSTQAERDRPPQYLGPNRQTDIIDVLAHRYGFSPRLLAIIKTLPPKNTSSKDHRISYKEKLFEKDDIETGRASMNMPRAHTAPAATTSHYTIAQQMINYQSVDVGARFMCIGANWMHDIDPPMKEKDNPTVQNLFEDRVPCRLWSWLILCDDNTVIAVHEDTGPIKPTKKDLKSLRGNTLSVLGQLSKSGHEAADPISMQSVRQVLDLNTAQANSGTEGASNLFYYLFDDWRAVYKTVAFFRGSLKELETSIFEDMTRNKRIRRMQHLYNGYHNLITRILEPKNSSTWEADTPDGSFMTQSGRNGVKLAASARQRFERLGDRLKLLILNETGEFLAEKDALSTTFFSINSQKDSQATARLNRSATLLAKLSVLFLPVSLMTSYFSTELSDIEGKYSLYDYWVGFAVVVSASFVCLFFFSKLLMWVTETLDIWTKILGKKSRHIFVSFLRGFERKKVKAGGEGTISGKDDDEMDDE